MGLLDLILGQNNPAAQWVDSNPGFVGALGSGIAAGPNFSQGLANAAQLVPQGRMMDYQAAEKKKADAKVTAQENATQAWIKAHYPQYADLPVQEGYQLALKDMTAQQKPATTDDITNYQFAKQNGYTGTFQDYQTQKGGAAETSLTPVWGTDSAGKPVLGQLNKAGKFVQTAMPDGVQPMDPGQLAGTKTNATVDAKTAGAARAALPAAQQAVAITTTAIDRLRNDPKGMDEWFGQFGMLPRGMYVQGGSPMANFQVNLEQAQGDAFLQARNVLKGAGQITDYEGRKAESAYSRMQASAEKGDKQSFLDALDDFEKAVEDGYQKIQDAANGDFSQGSPAVTGNSGQQTSTGVTWSYSP